MRLLIIVALAVLNCATTAEGASFRGFGFHNSEIYDFVVEPGNLANRWNSKTKPLPLSSEKAVSIATSFMKTIPVDKGWKWNLTKVTLHPITKDPEEWIFVVNFIVGPTNPKGGMIGFGAGIPHFDVPVQLDGKIPVPKVQRFGTKVKKSGP
jgi:hypothetical protein